MLSPRRARWRAALLTGLLSGTSSTILITLGAPRIGRSRALDWMEIGTVLLGVDSVVRQPGWHQIAAGVLVHQSADLFWAVIFFGAAGRWTARLPPIVLLFAGIPGAVGTSAPHEDHQQIPGMPSAAMMHQLEQLDGVELERQFFPVMMEHHRGAC